MTQTPEEFQKRIDEANKRALETQPQLVPLLKKPILTELPKVKETPPPEQPYYYPFKSEKEYVEALEESNDRLVAEIEHNELLKGKIPIGMIWWKLLAGGIGAALMGYMMKGCLG